MEINSIMRFKFKTWNFYVYKYYYKEKIYIHFLKIKKLNYKI